MFDIWEFFHKNQKDFDAAKKKLDVEQDTLDVMAGQVAMNKAAKKKFKILAAGDFHGDSSVSKKLAEKADRLPPMEGKGEKRELKIIEERKIKTIKR